MKNLATGWSFDNSYEKLPHMFFTHIAPTPVKQPELIALNIELAKSLGLNIEVLQDEQNIAVFAGNALPEGASPLAQAYAGHQFGHLNRLGDGRAILLGEQITPTGERFDIQLKGPGRTPYSRGGDGRAALGPMLREYIISEAMHALGIPTTRSLAVVTTGEEVMRETVLPGAILTRVAASHLRVGTFQYAAAIGTKDDLQALADYAIERHYPEIIGEANRYVLFLQQVMKRQASLIAKWQLVGFIHGVMNTDNMTISGETIDYGPCAFMDNYDPATVFSSIDTQGRYAYGNQPRIAGWNIARFAESLLPLLHDDEDQAIALAQQTIEEFPKLYHANWLAGMRAKLGLFNEEADDEALFEELLDLMYKQKTDYTNTFRALTLGQGDAIAWLSNEWYDKWQSRLTRQAESKEQVQQLMRETNPAYIPRNYRVEAAITAAVEQDDTSVLDELLDVVEEPFSYVEDYAEYANVPKSQQLYRTYCGT